MRVSAPTEELYSRITRLEASSAQLREDVAGLRGSIDRLTTEFQATRRPQWQTLASYMALLVMVLGMGGSLLALAGRSQLAPVEQLTAGLETKTKDLESRIDRTQVAMADVATTMREVSTRQSEKFTEVETQLRMLSELTNLRFHEHDRFQRLLWGKAYGEELPSNGLNPVVGRQ